MPSPAASEASGPADASSAAYPLVCLAGERAVPAGGRRRRSPATRRSPPGFAVVRTLRPTSRADCLARRCARGSRMGGTPTTSTSTRSTPGWLGLHHATPTPCWRSCPARWPRSSPGSRRLPGSTSTTGWRRPGGTRRRLHRRGGRRLDYALPRRAGGRRRRAHAHRGGLPAAPRRRDDLSARRGSRRNGSARATVRTSRCPCSTCANAPSLRADPQGQGTPPARGAGSAPARRPPCPARPRADAAGARGGGLRAPRHRARAARASAGGGSLGGRLGLDDGARELADAVCRVLATAGWRSGDGLPLHPDTSGVRLATPSASSVRWCAASTVMRRAPTSGNGWRGQSCGGCGEQRGVCALGSRIPLRHRGSPAYGRRNAVRT